MATAGQDSEQGSGSRDLLLGGTSSSMAEPNQNLPGLMGCVFDANPEKKEWDDGLNNGLIFRPESQKDKPEDFNGRTVFYGKAKPVYYGESNPVIVLAKAVAYALIAIAPYFTIFDQLSATVNFTPCNNVTCHYMRIFNSEHIPATGVNVISVQNGVDRPLAMRYPGIQPFACRYDKNNRTYPEKFWGPEATSCPPVSKKKYESFLDLKKERHTKDLVRDETEFAQNWTPMLRLSFLLTKVPLWIFAWPITAISKINSFWGMEHVPSARCPGKTMEEMQDTCNAINDKNKKYRSKGDEIIINHLAPFGPSKIGTYLGLIGYAFFTALHDILLLLGKSETITLTLGFCAIMSYGMGTIAVFNWAMGASEVFLAQVPGHPLTECACFYSMPEMSALIALTTPFAMFVGFMGKVQMQGLAALFGDYLSFQAYLVPHYLGKQSTLWTWSVMTTPKMAGTVQARPRTPFTKEWWGYLRLQQSILYWFTIAVKAFVALTSSAFMIAFKELCISLYMAHNMTPMFEYITIVLLCTPSLAAIAFGALAILDLASMTICIDKGETFFGQFKTVFTCGFLQCDARPSTFQNILRYASFVAGLIVIVVWTGAVAQGLSPDRNFLLGNEELTHPKLAQAELWGACGFVFFLVHVPVVLSIGFSTWEDLESLKYLEQERIKYDEGKKCYVVDATHDYHEAKNAPAYIPLNSSSPA
jgi:hypothetical protein